MTIAMLLTAGALALAGPASAVSSSALTVPDASCSKACPMIYDPVTCEMSDGTILTFSNRCVAGVFACKHGLKIVSCRAD